MDAFRVYRQDYATLILFIVLFFHSPAVRTVSACSQVYTRVEGNYLSSNIHTTADPNILIGTVIKEKACDWRGNIESVDVTIDLRTGSIVNRSSSSNASVMDVPELPIPVKDPKGGYSVTVENNLVLLERNGEVLFLPFYQESYGLMEDVFFVANGIAYIFLENENFFGYELGVAMINLSTLQISLAVLPDLTWILSRSTSILEVYENDSNEDGGGGGIAFLRAYGGMCIDMIIVSFDPIKGASLIATTSILGPIRGFASPTEFLQATYDKSFLYTPRNDLQYDYNYVCAGTGERVPIARPEVIRIVKTSLTDGEILEEYTLNADDINDIFEKDGDGERGAEDSRNDEGGDEDGDGDGFDGEERNIDGENINGDRERKGGNDSKVGPTAKLTNSPTEGSTELCFPTEVLNVEAIAGQNCIVNGIPTGQDSNNGDSEADCINTPNAVWLDYNCTTAESYLIGLNPEILDVLRNSWWRPVCCETLKKGGNNNVDGNSGYGEWGDRIFY